MELVLLVLLMALVIHFPRKSGPAIIKRENDDLPRIKATFNDDYQQEMILDTGATLTSITKKMADELKVERMGKVRIITGGGVVVRDFGTVDSIEVGGAKVENVEVTIGDVPLLGQSFFGNHEVIIKRDVVEFRE
ncbi:retroviral-like aspartic protease family protein [Brasilonema sp. CT11]|nr:retroviral-like aspartic protease family protein [Brasilonema sp. CT11]